MPCGLKDYLLYVLPVPHTHTRDKSKGNLTGNFFLFFFFCYLLRHISFSDSAGLCQRRQKCSAINLNHLLMSANTDTLLHTHTWKCICLVCVYGAADTSENNNTNNNNSKNESRWSLNCTKRLNAFIRSHRSKASWQFIFTFFPSYVTGSRGDAQRGNVNKKGSTWLTWSHDKIAANWVPI